MKRADVFEDLIDLFIKKAMSEESEEKDKRSVSFSGKMIRGESADGIYSSAGVRKQA